MKRLMLACAALSLLSTGALTACAPTDGGVIASPDATTMDEKALLALESAYNVAGASYLAAVDSGALTGAQKDEAKLHLDLAYGALVRARQAYEVGNSQAFKISAAFLRSSVEQAQAQISRK